MSDGQQMAPPQQGLQGQMVDDDDDSEMQDGSQQQQRPQASLPSQPMEDPDFPDINEEQFPNQFQGMRTALML